MMIEWGVWRAESPRLRIAQGKPVARSHEAPTDEEGNGYHKDSHQLQHVEPYNSFHSSWIQCDTIVW